MEKLAEFALKGRLQAFLMAAVIGLMPVMAWTSVAVVSLVALRKGLPEALWPLLGAAIPAGLAWSVGDSSFVGILLVNLAGSLILASTRKLESALLAIMLLSLLALFAITQVFSGQLDLLVEQYSMALQQMQMEAISPAELKHYAVQGLAVSVCWVALVNLFLARWLQARLFNPGGFREEFHSLRLSTQAVTGVALLLGAVYWVPGLEAALPVVVMPLIVAGLGLVHCWVARRHLGSLPLVVIYTGLVPPMMLIVVPTLMVMAVADSFINFRDKLSIPPDGGSE